MPGDKIAAALLQFSVCAQVVCGTGIESTKEAMTRDTLRRE